MDYVTIGCAPANEPCAQLGAEDYTRCAWRECGALIGQLIRTFGEPPPGARLSIKSCLHDFGTYYEVVCYFDPCEPEAITYAQRCEAEGPDCWDDAARAQLTGSTGRARGPSERSR